MCDRAGMRSLPEHSVDCWTAIAVRGVFPRAAVWAPTQNSRGNWDMAIAALGPYKAMLLENKGCEYHPASGRRPARHDITLDVAQLRKWSIRTGPPVFYVLPNPPWAAAPPAAVLPLATQCGLPTSGRSVCVSCGTSHPQGFGDWAYVIRAASLRAAIPVKRGAASFTREAAYFAALSGVLPLSRFLSEVAECRLVHLTAAGKLQRWDDNDDDRADVSQGAQLDRPSRSGLLAVQIPF